MLTGDEVTRLITISVERLGVTEIRFTGGEPLLRRGLHGLVARAKTRRAGITRRKREQPADRGRDRRPRGSPR